MLNANTHDAQVNNSCKGAWLGRVSRTLGCVLILSIGSSEMAAASNLYNATIQEIALDPAFGNFVLLKLSGGSPTGTPPSCVTNSGWTFTLSLSGTLSQQMYAALLAAQMAGKMISVVGYGNCQDLDGTEAMRSIDVPS